MCALLPRTTVTRAAWRRRGDIPLPITPREHERSMPLVPDVSFNNNASAK